VLCWIDNVRGFHERAAESAAHAVRAADASPNFEAHRQIPTLFHGLALESATRSTEAQATLVHGQALADRLATTWATPFYHYALALPHWNAGRWDDVLAECEAGLRYASAHDVSLASGWACAVSGSAHLHRNELDKAEALIADGEARLATAGVQYGIDWLLWARGLLTEVKGDAVAALGMLSSGWDVAQGLQAAAALVLVGPDLVRLALDFDDRDRARSATEALEQAEPDADRRNVDAHALRCRGLVDGDLEALEAARAMHEQCKRPVEVVLDQEALVVTALRRGLMDRGAALLAEALDACDQLGMRMVAERTLRAATRLGLTRAPRRRTRQVTGWGALTDTEQRVARLVAAGRSNPQVAHELVMSRRTVESHLYRIFFKLGVANRTELAGVVHRLNDR
jgi:DNA-binding NarL/FixJ family response regulator